MTHYRNASQIATIIAALPPSLRKAVLADIRRSETDGTYVLPAHWHDLADCMTQLYNTNPWSKTNILHYVNDPALGAADAASVVAYLAEVDERTDGMRLVKNSA